MKQLVTGLHASPPTVLPFATSLEVRAFLLRREAGNLLIYAAPAVEGSAVEIDSLGGFSRQYLNHWHEASFGCAETAETFDAPVLCHEDDSSEAARECKVDETFSGQQQLDDDFELIPIPGHTEGATAYLWDSGEHRLLFTGDSIMLQDGEWVAAVLDSSDRDAYIESLELVRDLDFDLLVPWAASAGQPPYAHTGIDDARARIEAIIDRLRRGENG